MSLLSIVSDAMLRLNQSKPANVFANQDTGVQQRMALLQDVGDELAERNFWQTLDINASITGDGVTTLFNLPSDFGGLSPGLQFTSSIYPLQPLVGPVTDETMAALKAFPTGLVRPVWRVINGQFEFWPALGSGEIATYNYYSPKWILQTGGARIYRWTADTDVSLIDEKVLTTGLEWRWLQAKGLDYAEAFRRYEMRLVRADGRQDTRREIAMSSRRTLADNIWPGLIPIFTQLTG